MNLLIPLLIGWATAAIAMLVAWVWQRRSGKPSIVDVVWAFGVATAGIAYALSLEGYLYRQLAIAGLASIWGLRLGGYLAVRVLTTAEDGRYLRFIREWGDNAQRNLFWFYQMQALWIVGFAFPILVAAQNPIKAWTWLDSAGLAIGLLAIVGEGVADRQLARFRKRSDSKGKVCNIGLWRYSRHPNYFFEWLHWFAYVGLGWGAAYGFLTLAGPVVMGLFLTRVTGIPLTEKQAIESRGDAYREYQRTTSAFFPWPPKRDREDPSFEPLNSNGSPSPKSNA